MRVFSQFSSIPGNMNNFKAEKRRPHSCSEWLTMARHTNRSSLREKLQEEFLSCKICLEPFIRPKALPCLHSFCEACLKDYVRRHPGERPGHFPCPMCRKDTKIPAGGINDFQDNFVLLSLSDTLEEDDVETWNLNHSGSFNQGTTHFSPPKPLAPLTPQEQYLRTYDWYFGKVSRHASEEWLLSPGYPKGTFLIRQGEAAPDTYTLSVRDCDELRGYLVKHYKIHKETNNDGLPCIEYYYITPKRRFRSLQDLVTNYSESPDGLCCKLLQACLKPRSLLWAFERGNPDEFHTERESIVLIKKLGSGQFAEVWLGSWHGSRQVAVKIQKRDAVTTSAFLDESQILKQLQHINVIKLLAVSSETEPIYILTEYMPNGRLSMYLREGKGKDLSVTQLLWIAAQIAEGMCYMEKEKFVHRNLGARNILVGEGNNVKIAGLGMTKVVDDPDFNFRRGLKMAIKWMAPEVLLCNKYSTKADIWSYGIVLIEIFTYGKEPYEDLLRMHSSSDVSYHSLWNRFGFNGHDTDNNRRREIIDDWNELKPLTINMYFCTSYYPNCDENDNILAISIDVTQTTDGNISKWDTVACKVKYTSTITTNCRFLEHTIEIHGRGIEISKQNGQFNIQQNSKTNSAQYLFVVGVYNETVCLCDCVYFDKIEAFKNQTREKKSMEELKEEMAPELAEMKKNLTVDPKKMSSFLNTKVSKGDERKSSKQIGVLGIVFLTIEVCALVLADLISYRQHWAMIRDNWNGFRARFF